MTNFETVVTVIALAVLAGVLLSGLLKDDDEVPP